MDNHKLCNLRYMTCSHYNHLSLAKFVSFCTGTEYEIATTTANTDDASTTENAWIVLEGRKARSKEFVLENKKKKFLRWVFRESKVPGSWRKPVCGLT